MSRIKRSICGAVVGTLVLVFTASASAMPPPAIPSWFWGCWVVTKSLPTAGISGISQKQANSIVGTLIVFSPTFARSGHTIVHAPKYSVKILSARDFFKLGYFSLGDIGIHASKVTEIDVALPKNMSDMDFYASQVFLRNGEIVINVENASFLAVRAKPVDTDCTCRSDQN